MNELKKNTHNQIQSKISKNTNLEEFTSRYHCDWGSSGMNEMSPENNDQTQSS